MLNVPTNVCFWAKRTLTHSCYQSQFMSTRSCVNIRETLSRPLFSRLERAMNEQRPPLPPFTFDSAVEKVRKAEDAWNSRDPSRVALAYTPDSVWRNRSEFIVGREAIIGLLTRKWNRELDYRLIKEIWTFRENRIAVR